MIAIGAYVLATKFSDGDLQDPWAVGFYAGEDEHGRHHVNDAEGHEIYHGFGRCETIDEQVGRELLENKDFIGVSLWDAARRVVS